MKYFRYWNKKIDFSIWQKNRSRHSYPCPGNKFDDNSKIKNHIIFEKYIKLENLAHKLYWVNREKHS